MLMVWKFCLNQPQVPIEGDENRETNDQKPGEGDEELVVTFSNLKVLNATLKTGKWVLSHQSLLLVSVPPIWVLSLRLWFYKSQLFFFLLFFPIGLVSYVIASKSDSLVYRKKIYKTSQK